MYTHPILMFYMPFRLWSFLLLLSRKLVYRFIVPSHPPITLVFGKCLFLDIFVEKQFGRFSWNYQGLFITWRTIAVQIFVTNRVFLTCLELEKNGLRGASCKVDAGTKWTAVACQPAGIYTLNKSLFTYITEI